MILGPSQSEPDLQYLKPSQDKYVPPDAKLLRLLRCVNDSERAISMASFQFYYCYHRYIYEYACHILTDLSPFLSAPACLSSSVFILGPRLSCKLRSGWFGSG